jgi:hypothetical protein
VVISSSSSNCNWLELNSKANMGDFEVSNSLLRKVLFFINNSQEYEDPSDMLELLRKSHSVLVNPNPLKRKAPNATDR